MTVLIGAVGLVDAAAAGAAPRIRDCQRVGTMNPLAGDGQPGIPGDGDPRSWNHIDRPTAVAYDPSGALYVADSGQFVVRRDSGSGLQLFAGTPGTSGSGGNGGPATAATLGAPYGVAVDAHGNVYIADYDHSQIRVVGAGGVIGNFAGTGVSGFGGDGGPATAAQLANPAGLAVDRQGRVLIADQGNNRIRRVDPATGVITTVAGSTGGGFAGDHGPATSALLLHPMGVALDLDQDIVIADTANSRVRVVDASTGVITTIAGTGTPESSADGGPAVAASLYDPFGVVVDNASHIFVSENGGQKVRRIGANGIIATVAGTGSGGNINDCEAAVQAFIDNPTGLAISPSSGLVIADGGNHIVHDVVGIASQGYVMAGADGGVFTHGSAIFYGPLTAPRLNQPIVTMAATPTAQGYWLFAADGGVFTFGNAQFHGSEGGLKLVQPVVAAAATPDGNGYWMFAADGGVFTHGDAAFYGSEGGVKLVQPIVAAASTPSGHGYWLFAGDGGVFTHGDAAFYGSQGGTRLNQPIVAAAATPSGRGYWLFASDGGVFTHGDAAFYGSEGARRLNQPIAASASTPTGKGYWLFARDGGVFTHGDAGFFGSEGGLRLSAPIVAAAAN